ncbi:hypothetical protein NHX12_014985 [Muraenolepis orangiensis]|uniref:Beta/gamma crystallin 'Greek key' domain-containing protein n=1 Tax=Muraenolepis orangiensis TaxID=630683 RepID=A0A9Q0D9K8_9TELE|nr:hypothetical protein NHX12_014985 [Muraenolepis orangiensis]
MGKIIFYEDRNFAGRHHDCMSDCGDLHSYFNRCQSFRVESGMFVVYDRADYAGHQHFVRRGDYADYQRSMGMTDCVRSCRMIPTYRGNFRMRLYGSQDMSGQTMELSDDCPDLMERFRLSEVASCSVPEGHWLLYERPDYQGPMYYLRPGDYRRCGDWGSVSGGRVGSIRRLMDF